MFINISTKKRGARSVKVIILSLSLLVSAHLVYGQSMTSSSYKIQSDSVNFGGGRSTSTSYNQENTAGEVATGESQSSSYKVSAGYQQMQEIYLAVTAAADVTMSPSLGGITGGTSNGSTYFKVTTDNPAGYTVTLTSSSSAGMLGVAQGGTIPAYTHTGSTTPQFTFTTPANTARFGYTVEASTTANLAAAFKDNGTLCGVGSADAVDSCWINASTTSRTILSSQSRTPTSGATSTIKFRVVVSPNPVPAIPADIYRATTTITVLPQ